jgi:hypothetical protein
MPGYAQQMADFSGKKSGVALGKQIEQFIDQALLDFTHMTVLLYLVREGKSGCTPGGISSVIGDPKKVIQQVLDRFQKLGLVRISGGFLSRKYFYEREGPRAMLVSRLIKLWEHKQAHEVVLKKVLTPKS